MPEGGKFNVYEEIISLQFTVHDASHHICKQYLKNYKSGVDFEPTYENSTKKFFKATVPKPIRQGFPSRKRPYRYMT